ncbi:MAG TPA: hypothetical protein VNZ22_17300, partial [Bacillota bacterium]|nr:hypothetical protein [Bacillota bacterium]
MKAKILTVACAAAVGLASSSVAKADTTDPTAVAADALVGRPACFVATVVGSAIFVVSLPVAAISKSVKSAAQALVVTPAYATFKRPLGD